MMASAASSLAQSASLTLPLGIDGDQLGPGAGGDFLGDDFRVPISRMINDCDLGHIKPVPCRGNARILAKRLGARDWFNSVGLRRDSSHRPIKSPRQKCLIRIVDIGIVSRPQGFKGSHTFVRSTHCQSDVNKKQCARNRTGRETAVGEKASRSVSRVL